MPVELEDRVAAQNGVATTTPTARRTVTSGQMHPRAGEILGRFADLKGENEAAIAARNEIVATAHERKMTLTNYLESLDPSSNYDDGLDAFERQLLVSGIRTQSDPVKGIFADPVNRFYASDQPASPVLFPEFINRQMRVALLAPPILDELIAITTPVDSDSYRTIYLQDTTATRRMSRVAEGGELPRVKVATSEKSISLKKYGVILEGTYEVYRRMRIDLFALHLSRIALQAMLDKSQEALDVAINGDGNGNAATNYNLTALDPNTTAGKLTYYAWLRWGLKLFPYQLTTVVGGEAELLSVLTLQFPNINPLMILSMLQNDGPVNMRLQLAQDIYTNIRLVYLQTAPSNVLLGIDRRSALEMAVEIGASLTETDRIISRQLNEIAISEVVAMAQLMPQAIQSLTLNA